MKLYSETFTYKQYDENFHISSMLKDLKNHITIVDKEVFSSKVLEIDKMVNISIKKSVMKDFDEKAIVFFVTNDDFPLPSTVPVFIVPDKTSNLRYRAIVNITGHSKISKDEFGKIESVEIENKKMFTLLATGWIYRKLFLDDSAFFINSGIVKVAANMYARLCYKILDKKWSIGVDFKRVDVAMVIFAYFFAYYVAGEPKRALDIASAIDAVTNLNEGVKVARDIIKHVKDPKHPFKDFRDCIELLNKSISEIVPIDALTFIGVFAQHWQGSTVPGIDYLPYFVMTIVSSFIGAGLARDTAVLQVVRKDADTFIKMLSEVYK